MILFEREGGGFGNVVHCAPGSWTTKRIKGQKVKETFQDWTDVRLGGRHNTGAGMEADIDKYNSATILGWIVLRATIKQIQDGRAVKSLEAAFNMRRAQGYPLLQGARLAPNEP